MKIPHLLTRKKKLSASTAARRSRSLGLPEEMDYEQMSEPNMKLSRALLIVLVLHVVAVAGIVAFNTIKTRETLAPASPETTAAAVAEASVAPATDLAPAAIAPNEAGKVATAPAAPSAPAKATAPAASNLTDSGKTYTVLRGDNPVTIARHLKVSEADLLELNQITDPRKLQINQKLRVPEAHRAAKTKVESP